MKICNGAFYCCKLIKNKNEIEKLFLVCSLLFDYFGVELHELRPRSIFRGSNIGITFRYTVSLESSSMKPLTHQTFLTAASNTITMPVTPTFLPLFQSYKKLNINLIMLNFIVAYK